MTYSKRMTEETSRYLGHIIPKILELKPSQSILIKGYDEKHINVVRNHFYSWCRLFDKKALYRTAKETATTLRIVCIETRPAEIIQEIPFTPAENFVIKNLLEIDDRAEAQELVLSAWQDGKIKEEDCVPIMEEWQRKQG